MTTSNQHMTLALNMNRLTISNIPVKFPEVRQTLGDPKIWGWAGYPASSWLTPAAPTAFRSWKWMCLLTKAMSQGPGEGTTSHPSLWQSWNWDSGLSVCNLHLLFSFAASLYLEINQFASLILTMVMICASGLSYHGNSTYLPQQFLWAS